MGKDKWSNMRSFPHRIMFSLRPPEPSPTSCCSNESERGQGTVEAAFALPILLLCLLLVLQPGIVLYDRMVMQAAAAEGCRLLATKTSSLGSMDAAVESYVRHRLGSVPQQDCFHVHDGALGCSWDIACSGDERSQTVEVSIRNELRPLPLLDAAAALLNLVNENGNLVVEVSASAPIQPDWATEALVGRSPEDLVGAWLE